MTFPRSLTPYRGFIVFAVTLVAANTVWKLSVHGDEAGVGDVMLWGMTVTPFFEALARHTATAVHRLLCLTREGITLVDNVIRFPEGHGNHIVWGCTPVKQSFIWLCLMLTASGAWKHKLWYIPLGWGIIYGFNILRIYWISLMMQPHPELFHLFHNYLFKYLFYFVIFLMWVLWEQVIGGASESRRTQTSKYQHKNQQL
ncbi:MAG: hypothetical protein IJT35_04030 [Paludibacteraceae bacterium]|nr:hypothetical protein [Paludibacteraceae bacterium]